jgi:epoxyqueuosine reductase
MMVYLNLIECPHYSDEQAMMNSSGEADRAVDLEALASDIPQWAQALGFSSAAIGPADPGAHAQHLDAWLERGQHGTMGYMERHRTLRQRPDQLLPGTLRVISVTLDYLTDTQPLRILNDPKQGYISRYALGRDYHKMMRKRLAKLAQRIERAAGGHHRAFVDSAPVLERGLAQQSGLGWIGKNTMLLQRKAGSWFFLGEIYTDLPLPTHQPYTHEHCGRCTACLDICPTQAFTGPYQLDARRCISYLTIEHKGSIDQHLRPLMGNRIYGCDDCQLVCPWNRFARPTPEPDFQPRHGLDDQALLSLFSWSEEQFLQYTEGSAIRRIGYECWQRNIAVALGNAPHDNAIVAALQSAYDPSSPLVREHIAWALQQLTPTSSGPEATRSESSESTTQGEPKS